MKVRKPIHKQPIKGGLPPSVTDSEIKRRKSLKKEKIKLKKKSIHKRPIKGGLPPPVVTDSEIKRRKSLKKEKVKLKKEQDNMMLEAKNIQVEGKVTGLNANVSTKEVGLSPKKLGKKDIDPKLMEMLNREKAVTKNPSMNQRPSKRKLPKPDASERRLRKALKKEKMLKQKQNTDLKKLDDNSKTHEHFSGIIKIDPDIEKKFIKGDDEDMEIKEKNALGDRSKNNEKFPGRKKIDPDIEKKYKRGDGVDVSCVRNRRHKVQQIKLKNKEKLIKETEEETARAEVLLTETSGLLETEEGTNTTRITQTDIRKAVDITSASKSFDLKLRQFGPYKMQFTRNGRHLLLGGRKGHLASFDWITKKLHFEINVMESIHDVTYLHTENMMAVAQKKWVYMYDSQGVELHCLKRLDDIHKLEYLPYHFLLCAGGETGYLSWLDISLGKEMLVVYTDRGRVEIMRQNPYNAVMCCGHTNGVVTMWTPNERDPVATMLCHTQPVRAIEFDPAGRYFATAGSSREIKIWDARSLGSHLHSYTVGSGVSGLSFSQKRLLAVSSGNVCEVYDNATTGAMQKPYMHYRCESAITGMQFCPYEDVLGLSTYTGYSSLIIPGAGEPNFDALEANPYMSKSGRREAEVKALLGKIPHELISLDPASIGQVDVPTLQEKLEARRALEYVKVPKLDVTPRYRMKGKSGSAQKFKRKQQTLDTKKQQFIKNALVRQKEHGLNKNKVIHKKTGGILGRFNRRVQGK